MFVIRNKKTQEYLMNKNSYLLLTKDVNKARVFKNKQAASCSWTWATYGSEHYLNYEILEVEIKLK